MRFLPVLCWIPFSLFASCINNLQYATLLITDNGGNGDNNNTRTSTVESISSIQVLKKMKKEPSADILRAMQQCEAAILKSKNDEMQKGPSFCLGILKQSIGDQEGALIDYERAVTRFPANGPAIFNAAAILESLGRDKEAAVKYKSSMIIPELCEASFAKLIPLLLRNGKDVEAKTICSEMINSPYQISVTYKAFQCLGSVLHKLGSYKESLSAYESALNICENPLYSSDVSEKRHVEALNNAAQAAAKISTKDLKRAEKAEEYHLKSIDIAPDNADSHTYYGIFLRYENRISEAENEFLKAITLDPKETFAETGYAAIQLASITGGSSQKVMNRNYISGLFDGYADRFDDELCGRLEYKGHEQVVTSLLHAFHGMQNVSDATSDDILQSSQLMDMNVDIIDIGSGTGLCGSLIRQKMPNAHISGEIEN